MASGRQCDKGRWAIVRFAVRQPRVR
jgi:hypothetical protein